MQQRTAYKLHCPFQQGAHWQHRWHRRGWSCMHVIGSKEVAVNCHKMFSRSCPNTLWGGYNFTYFPYFHT